MNRNGKLTRAKILILRLNNQQLLKSAFHKPSELLKYLGAVQAQDFHGAKWALGQRLRNGSAELIEKAFADGEIVRTHVMRPTWHFVAAADIRWLLKLTAPRVNVIARHYYRKFELDDAIFKRTHKALERALRGKQLTRAELRTVVTKAGVACDDLLRLNFILLRAELDALICSGARRGKQFTYALFDERVPATRVLTRDEALVELTRRYFVSRGPATLKDFVWWSGLSTADARTGVDMIRDDLSRETIDGEEYWLSPKSAKAAPEDRLAHLLPNFDEYFVAYKDRRAAIDPQPNRRANESTVIFKSPVIMRGVFVGHWKQNVTKDDVAVDFDLLSTPSTSDARALAAVVDRYRKFLG